MMTMTQKTEDKAASKPMTITGQPINIQDLLTKQDTMGWEAAFWGCWLYSCAEAQEQHLKFLQNKKFATNG